MFNKIAIWNTANTMRMHHRSTEKGGDSETCTGSRQEKISAENLKGFFSSIRAVESSKLSI